MEIEINEQAISSDKPFKLGGTTVMITPPIDESYWIYRVKLTEDQAIVAFPKFGIIGIGFQKEDEDWNLNLPSGCGAKEIFEHISRNKGDPEIDDSECVKAIELIQEIVREHQQTA